MKLSHAFFAVLLCAFAPLPETCFAQVSPETPIPIAGYREKLKQAITALDTLAQRDEEETDSEFQTRLLETVDAVRAALPEQMTVEADADVCKIDNSSLHQSLGELKEMGVDDQHVRIRQVIDLLRAIELRIAERQSATALAETKEQAKSKLEAILARPEYVTNARGPNALVRLIQDFIRWLQRLFPERRPIDQNRIDWISLIARIVVVGLAIALLIYVGTILLRKVGHTRKTKTRKKREARIVLGERLEPEATATDLLSQAETLARNGDLRAAIRKAYIALLVELGDRKMISLAQHKTNRDYLNSVRSIPPLHATMRGLTDSFERHWYGFEQATADDWQDFRAGYLAALQAES